MDNLTIESKDTVAFVSVETIVASAAMLARI